MKLKILLFLFLSSCSISLIAQKSEKAIFELKSAHEQISNLKDGVLLVRLFTKSKGIEAYRRKGATSQADKIERAVKSRNINIVQAFKKEYSFSQVAFFFSDESEAVKTGNFDQVTFLNDSLELDTSVKPLDFGTVFIGELSRIESVNEDTGQVGRGFSAFIIRDARFNQLKKPFPYYQRSYEGVFFINRTESTVVKKLQAKLEKFYL